MDILKDKFNILNIEQTKDGFEKITVHKNDVKNCLYFMKNSGEFAVDMLISITAADLINKIELTYHLYSSKLNKHYFLISDTDSNNPVTESVSAIFKSAVFDEREILDLFGVSFEGLKNTKRLIMPDFTTGHPLLKNYKNSDKRLNWNE